MKRMEKHFIEFGEDDAGFFYIYVDEAKRKIVVEHYKNVIKVVDSRDRTVSGNINKVFNGSDAQIIYRTILGNKLVHRLDHAAYLGYELAKAEIALKNSLKYEQDRMLHLRT